MHIQIIEFNIPVLWVILNKPHISNNEKLCNINIRMCTRKSTVYKLIDTHDT